MINISTEPNFLSGPTISLIRVIGSFQRLSISMGIEIIFSSGFINL